ncbi:uncharacterized protein [Misgurnus anguillicaudatus]|uniref:uncharacterized protein n=1 Tax=Misgurnus anguillicaudatus TaxID=75329 RepID=UPI003CCF25C9
MLTFVLDNKKFSINITNIRAEDKVECEIREEETKSDPYSSRFKFIIQVKPHTEEQEANLNCSVPFPYPKTLPDISWWIKQNEKGFKLKKITFTTSEGIYAATLTFMPTAGLHNATVECEARYGNTTINTSSTIEVTCVSNKNQSHHIEDFLQSLGLSRLHTFLVGIAISAVFFSVVLCCWVSCNRTKKPEVLDVPADSVVHLEEVQTNIDSAVNDEQTNEETPLLNQFDVEMSSTQVEMTGPAEENEAGGEDGDVDYAAIDYSLMKEKPPEEEEEETANTDYAEIKKDKKGRTTHQNQDNQVEISNEGSENQKQNEGEEDIYSNSQELEILADYSEIP